MEMMANQAVLARDARVRSISAGVFHSALSASASEDVGEPLAAAVSHSRLGRPDDSAAPAARVVEGGMRSGGAIRMAA